jgi:hypothetical protein
MVNHDAETLPKAVPPLFLETLTDAYCGTK